MKQYPVMFFTKVVTASELLLFFFIDRSNCHIKSRCQHPARGHKVVVEPHPERIHTTEYDIPYPPYRKETTLFSKKEKSVISKER